MIVCICHINFVQQMNLNPIPNTIDINDLEDGFWSEEVGCINSFDNDDIIVFQEYIHVNE